MNSTEKQKQRCIEISSGLQRAAQNLNILTHIGWSLEVKHGFFKHHAKNLPIVSYQTFDSQPVCELIAQIKPKLGDSLIDRWFMRHAIAIEKSAKMLSHSGHQDFFKYSSELYGKPTDLLQDETSNSLELAQKFNQTLAPNLKFDLGAPPKACHLADTVAAKMQQAVQKMFADKAPRVEIVEDLSANALAGKERIRIRRTACFTDKDVDQLINHEAYIHVATLLNGHAQSDLKILSSVHPGSTKTQEGLAVFSEFISGSIDIDRIQRLADRTIAIQMAIEGADFIQVYNYFLQQTGSQDQAFENSRRVFRGGVLQGGAPFTKDLVYLDGLLRVHNYLRCLVACGRADCLRLLFVGRLDIEDMPAIGELFALGLCRPPLFLPPWAKDLRFLLAYLAYSSFLNQVDLRKVESHYRVMLQQVPELDMTTAT